MLPVADASFPAVEICSDSSAAGKIFWALVTFVIRQKDHLDEIPNRRIAVDHLSDPLINLIIKLGHEIARCRLPPKIKVRGAIEKFGSCLRRR